MSSRLAEAHVSRQLYRRWMNLCFSFTPKAIITNAYWNISCFLKIGIEANGYQQPEILHCTLYLEKVTFRSHRKHKSSVFLPGKFDRSNEFQLTDPASLRLSLNWLSSKPLPLSTSSRNRSKKQCVKAQGMFIEEKSPWTAHWCTDHITLVENKWTAISENF